ncbi:uncharacterized protein GLRG_01940 [Colletotrichum graminicola M1.001]|uniref:Uncharacterized protein n=1 Tax=Colletotrichum graminicola (strain M1.001 / M2 / FGSC 10212) TaxID=645133 RepID=E3Q8T1_COLGM|nr:uncharacterized protein GLRG_01940 [Colletotrichum graminicola M1.001]EFQ27445.1 hypothetical protein GLRG_01940 [Colletotrichum graminicola M1.001]
MASDTQTAICLDIAVDHRIRKLLKPVPRYATDTSTHVSRLEQEGRSLRLPRAEIQVTAQLAGPPVKGGIVVMLQQPRHNHPFEEGLGAVIDNCETLRALEDIFTVVSRGTLDFRKDVAVIDLLPYVSGDPRDVDDTRLKNAFRTSTATICDKRPDVLLCAGKIMMPLGRAKTVKGDSYKFENIGIGEQFGRVPKWQVRALVRPEGQHYQELYSETLFDVSMCVSRLIPTDQGYEVLLNSALSEKCNNASLILRQMLRLKERGWLESVAWINEAALERVAADTDQFATDTYHFVQRPAPRAARLPVETPLARMLRENLDLIFTRATVVQRREEYDFSLKDAANDFLDLAVKIETLLLNLLREKEAALYAHGQEDVLSKKLSGLTLAPIATPVTTLLPGFYRRQPSPIRMAKLPSSQVSRVNSDISSVSWGLDYFQEEKITPLAWRESPVTSSADEDTGDIRLFLRHNVNPVELFYNLFFISNLESFGQTYFIANLGSLTAYLGFFGIT